MFGGSFEVFRWGFVRGFGGGRKGSVGKLCLGGGLVLLVMWVREREKGRKHTMVRGLWREVMEGCGRNYVGGDRWDKVRTILVNTV